MTVCIREATQHEDSLIAEHFYQLWRDNNVPAKSIQSNWLNITLEFINHARQELDYKAFVAEVDGKVIGSTSCQLFSGLYPRVLAEHCRKYGYVWGVYVEPSYRRQGIAKQLTKQAISYQNPLNAHKLFFMPLHPANQSILALAS